MKVGDIVYHKVNTEMSMVVIDLQDYGGGKGDSILCRWWNGLKYEEDNFIPKELLFDGEQQQKPTDKEAKGDKDG